jgi:hypothetical protein
MKLPKHHYIPVFYLREWAQPDGRLLEFSRPTGNDVKTRPTSPTGTGYVRGLYRLDHLSGDAAEAYEKFFFSLVDNRAKDGLDILLGRSAAKWNDHSRTAWSQFVLGMLFRNPERIAATRKFIEDFTLENSDKDQADYEAQRKPGDPDYLEYLVRNVAYTTVDWTKGMLLSPKLGQHMNNMFWSVRDVSDGGLKLFTSDRPVVMTNGLGYDWSNLVMPISPTKAFIATNSRERYREMHAMRTTEFTSKCNEKILRYAQKFAWNTDDLQINAARRNLSAESDVSRMFFDAPPLRTLQSMKQPEV